MRGNNLICHSSFVKVACLLLYKENVFTSRFLGENLTEADSVSALWVTFLSEIDEVIGSFLGESFIFLGEMVILLPGDSSLTSSLFFIIASLELVLTGAGLFFGDGPLTFWVVLIRWPFFAGLPPFSTAESEQFCL